MGLLCGVNVGGRDMMKGLCAALVAVTAFAVPAAEAQTERTVTTTKRVANAPRARVTVPPRSFLDAGTEVRQGERKFTDYAFPPGYTSSTGTVTNIGGKVGSARDPFMEPFQLPGFSPW
jgi:Ni/Co efflux regulator RcnB